MKHLKLFGLSWAMCIFLVGCGGGGGGSSTPVDTSAPVITITGATTVNHEQGTTYTDEGATAQDAVDGTITVSTSGTVDAAAGTYTITYSATDSAGNTGTATRTVIVADTTAPTISLVGSANVAHEQGTTYVDEGATATDTVDSSVEVVTTGSVSTATAGTYTLTYTATDQAGNVSTATRTVVVADTVAPVISLIGNVDVSHEEGTEYVDAGATAFDTADGNVPVVTSGTVNTNVVGSYTLDYNASDSAGNTAATVTRTINVIAASPDITLTLKSHSSGSLIGDIVSIIVTVDSVYEIVSLTAQIDATTTTLTYSEEGICDKYGCGPAFVGELNLTGSPSSDYTMVIRATDSTAQIAQISVTVTLDRAPTLTVTSPVNLSVARPTIPLNLSCGDDSASCTIVVSIENGPEIARGTDTLEQNLDLTGRDGQLVKLVISAIDASQQTAMDSRSIYVETSEFIEAIFEAPAEVLDFVDSRVLHRTAVANALVISDLPKTNQTTINLPVDYESGGNAYLSPYGAILIGFNGTSVLDANLFDFNDGNLYDLGFPNSAHSLVTRGNYAIWSNAKILNLRDLSNKTNRIVSNNAGNTNNDVAESGQVTYWDYNYSVVLDSDGAQTTIASDVNLWNTYPLTDGNSVVYRKHDVCCSNQNYSLYVYRANSNTLLSNLGFKQPSQGRDYQINNGWIAFTDIGSTGQKQVWTLDPSNVRLKRNAFGTDSTIIYLASNGELIFTLGGEYYLSKTDGTHTELGLSQGQIGYDIDGWHLTLGREVFRIQTPVAP